MNATLVFTARCTIVQSAVLRSHVVCPKTVRPSVCLSVCDVGDCVHIGWNYSTIISPLVSLGCSLSADPNMTGLRRSYGVSGSALAWFSSYLSGRSASVRLQNLQSSSYSCPYGVPQGSVLGPLLFILYVADIAGIDDRHGIQSHFYADDAQLYLTCHRSKLSSVPDGSPVASMRSLTG